MKKKCIIFGITDFGEMIRYYIEKYTDMQIIAYTVDEKYIKDNVYHGLPVIAFENIEKAYPIGEYTMILAIGYKKMNQIRKQKYEEIKRKGYKVENFIHPSVVNEAVELGEGNIILENVTLAYGTKLGNCNIIWNGCQISHESVVGNYNFFSVDSVIAGKTRVENNCFLGINCTVQGDRTLSDYTLVGAGAYVKENTEPYSVYVPTRSMCLENKKSTEMKYMI